MVKWSATNSGRGVGERERDRTGLGAVRRLAERKQIYTRDISGGEIEILLLIAWQTSVHPT